jgi:hypothetical protein
MPGTSQNLQTALRDPASARGYWRRSGAWRSTRSNYDEVSRCLAGIEATSMSTQGDPHRRRHVQRPPVEETATMGRKLQVTIDIGGTLSAWDQLLIEARCVPPPADRSERERPADVPRPHPAHSVRNPTSAWRGTLRLTSGSPRARSTGRSSRRSALATASRRMGSSRRTFATRFRGCYGSPGYRPASTRARWSTYRLQQLSTSRRTDEQ